MVTCDYRAWNAEIIPFVLRVHQRAFRYLIYPNTLRYLPQHGVVGVRTGNVHFKFLHSLLCFSLRCFRNADVSSFLASDFSAFFSSSIRARSLIFLRYKCHYTQHNLCHKSRLTYHTVLFHLLYTLGNPLFNSHFRDLNGPDLWSNFLIATPAFSTTLSLYFFLVSLL